MGQQLVLSEGHLLNYSRLCALTASPQTLIGRRCRFLSALPSPESRCAEWRCRIAIGILRVIHLSGPSQGCFGQKMSARHRGISGLAGAIDSARPRCCVGSRSRAGPAGVSPVGGSISSSVPELFPGVCTPSPGVSLRSSPTPHCNGLFTRHLPAPCEPLQAENQMYSFEYPQCLAQSGSMVGGRTDGRMDRRSRG